MKISLLTKKYVFMCCIPIFILSGCGIVKKENCKADVTTKGEWTVPLNLKGTKSENEFDTIIVGSGIGGLTCGSLLAKNGLKVLVLEQHNQVGGFCSSYSRDGFTFTVGVEDVSGLWKHGMVKKLLDTLGLRKDDLFVMNSRMFVLDDKKITLTGTKQDFIEQISKMFPSEKRALTSFMNEAEQAILAVYGVDMSDKASYSILKNWKSVTYQQKLDEFFTNPDLKKFMCSLLGYLGTKPDKTIAATTIVACLQYFIHGGFYVKGGPQNFANALKEIIEQNGGKILINSRVDKILVEDGHVSGVKAGDDIFNSSIIVSNANAKTTFCKLLPQGAIDHRFVGAIANLKMSKSIFAVQLGVDLDLSYLPSVISIRGKEGGCHIVMNSNADHSLAPNGKTSMTMLTWGSYNETPEPDITEYLKYKDEMSLKLIAKVEKLIPNLSKHIVFKDVLTPKSFERFTSMPEGAVYAFDQSAGSKRPYFKTPIKGLYLSSASSHGGGVESVVVAGFECADDILRNIKSVEFYENIN